MFLMIPKKRTSKYIYVRYRTGHESMRSHEVHHPENSGPIPPAPEAAASLNAAHSLLSISLQTVALSPVRCHGPILHLLHESAHLCHAPLR